MTEASAAPWSELRQHQGCCKIWKEEKEERKRGKVVREREREIKREKEMRVEAGLRVRNEEEKEMVL